MTFRDYFLLQLAFHAVMILFWIMEQFISRLL